MKKVLSIACLLFTLASFSQQPLRYDSGEIQNNRNKNISGKEMREILATKPGMLATYKGAQTKKHLGGFMIGFGGGLMIGDLVLAMTSDSPYPSAVTYVGAGTALVSIPIMSGYRKQLKSVVEDYNKEIAVTESKRTIDQIYIVANHNGAGVRITF